MEIKQYSFYTDNFIPKNVQKISNYSESLLGQAMLEEFLERRRAGEERVVPDKRGCEIIFARTFVNDQMYWDFPLIARDFLKKEVTNFPRYKDLAYGDDTPQSAFLDSFWHRTMIHLMYEGAKQGSEYCIALLKYLFKTYYSKLYKSFKRFKSFSADEVIALVQDEDGMNRELSAVVLCMADIFGMEVREDCDVLYVLLNKLYNKIEKINEVPFFEFESGLFEQCRKEVEELFGTDTRKMLKKKFNTEKFVNNALMYHNLSEDFIFLNMAGDDNVWGTLARTLALLKTAYPNRDFSKEEILVHANLYEAVNTIAYTANNTYENFIDVLDIGDDSSYREEEVWFNPEKIQTSTVHPAKQTEPKPVEAVSAKDEREYSQEALIKEIDELRNKLHIKEQENKNLRTSLREVKRLQEENQSVVKLFEDSRQELAALRSHLYHFTEYDVPAEAADFESMVKELAVRNVVIVGGHSNWVQKMKKIFPDWDFISPKVSGSNDGKWVSNAEFVYFFTDTLSHSVYNTFIHIVRKHTVPFGYIHGVNIEANVKQIYEELVVDLKE